MDSNNDQNSLIPDKGKELLKINLGDDIFFDIEVLSDTHGFIKDMQELDIGIALALHMSGDILSSSGLLGVTKSRIANRSRKPSVQRLLRLLIKSDLFTFGLKKAYDTAMGIMDDTEQAPAARLKAAEMVLKWSGELDKAGGKDDDRTNLADLSVEQLNNLVNNLTKNRGLLLENTPN